MKKLCILLLLSFCSILNLYAGEKTAGSSAIPVTSTDEYTACNLRLPHADLEVSVLSVGISQANPAVKKINCDNESTSVLLTVHCLDLISFCRAKSTIHSKDYLFYIYPSHNFW